MKNEGPIVKKFLTCDTCVHLKDATFSDFGNMPYKCYHDGILKIDLNSYNLMRGDICKDKITPSFCPYLIKKLRLEKIKEIKND